MPDLTVLARELRKIWLNANVDTQNPFMGVAKHVQKMVLEARIETAK